MNIPKHILQSLFSQAIPKSKKVVNNYDKTLKEYGGIKKCGYSITLAASYYALHNLKPSVIGYLGADMNYNPDKKGNTHIYGVGFDIQERGVPDPDKMVKDHGNGNENYLEDIYKRFEQYATTTGCVVRNFSSDNETRLPYTRSNPYDFV